MPYSAARHPEGREQLFEHAARDLSVVSGSRDERMPRYDGMPPSGGAGHLRLPDFDGATGARSRRADPKSMSLVLSFSIAADAVSVAAGRRRAHDRQWCVVVFCRGADS